MCEEFSTKVSSFLLGLSLCVPFSFHRALVSPHITSHQKELSPRIKLGFRVEKSPCIWG